MTLASLYQVDYMEEDLGKLRKSTKKKVTWVFRFTDNAAEEEHAVSFTWSKNTGKQEIEMDNGAEKIWFGRKQGASVFDHSWSWTANTAANTPFQFQILATCAPKLHKTFRCYDLIINGQVFDKLPQYQNGKMNHHSHDDDNNNIIISSNTDDNYDDNDDVNHDDNEVQHRPQSILEVLYPNGYIASTTAAATVEQRQPSQQHPQDFGSDLSPSTTTTMMDGISDPSQTVTRTEAPFDETSLGPPVDLLS